MKCSLSSNVVLTMSTCGAVDSVCVTSLDFLACVAVCKYQRALVMTLILCVYVGGSL